MISPNARSFPAGKSVENGSPPGMRCCAGSRAHRKTIHSPGPSNAVIGMSSPPPSNPAKRRSRKGKGRLSCLLLIPHVSAWRYSSSWFFARSAGPTIPSSLSVRSASPALCHDLLIKSPWAKSSQITFSSGFCKSFARCLIFWFSSSDKGICFLLFYHNLLICI
jgi:hypothetical protein